MSEKLYGDWSYILHRNNSPHSLQSEYLVIAIRYTTVHHDTMFLAYQTGCKVTEITSFPKISCFNKTVG